MQVKSLDSRASAIAFIEVVICLVINITSLVGNILVCLSVYRNSRLRTSTNLYIIGLAIADLLSAVIVMPFTTIVLISGDWIIGPFLCDLHAFVMNFVLFVSPTTMALTAFNRYIRIVKPGKYMTVFSKRRSVMMLGSAWAFVAFYVAIPKLSGLQDYGFVPGYALCHVIHLSDSGSLVHYIAVITLFLITPFTVAIVCYFKVSEAIRQHNLDIAPGLQLRRSRYHITIHEIKISKSLFVVVLAFILCWIPAWAVAIVIRFRLLEAIPRGVQLFCSLSVYTSSAVNPFIYSGMNRSFRQEFKKILKCRSVVTPAWPRNNFHVYCVKGTFNINTAVLSKHYVVTILIEAPRCWSVESINPPKA